MPRLSAGPASTASGRRPARAPRRPKLPSIDPYALLGLGTALGLVDSAEDVARLTASALTSALSAPFGAVVLGHETGAAARVVGQLGGAPLEAAPAREIERFFLSSWAGALAFAADSSAEIDVREDVLPLAARAGLRRLLLARLGTLETSFGAVIAGKKSVEPHTPEERAALETLAGQASMALHRIELAAERTKLAERLRTLNELTLVAVSSLDMSEVIDRVAEQVKRLVDHDRLTIALHPPDADYVEIYAVAAGGRPVFAKGTRMPLETPMGEAILTGRPVLRRNIPDDLVYPAEFELMRREGYRSTMYVPLASKGRVIGTLNLGSRRHVFSERELGITQEIADHLAVIVEHARLYEESKEQARLEERNRLAREIHDTLAQSLVAIMVQLEAAEELVRKEPDAARAEVHSARNLARESLEEARRSVWNLRPRALGSGTLTEAVGREVERARGEGIQASLDVEGTEPESLDSRCELAVLRIVQEAVSNILHHAGARTADVGLAFGPGEMRIRISDDGVGFDPSAAPGVLSPTAGGFGLVSMQERARLAGGHAEVHSAPGMGTRVEALIPCHSSPQEAPALTKTSTTANIPGKGASGRIRVLVVDDHEVVRQGIRNVVEQAEGLLVVGEAADGEAAIEQIRTLAPDVVLMDIQMPKLDGVGALQRLRELGLESRVIVLSVYAKDEHIFAGLRAGAQGYLMKDVGRDDLVHAIRTVHEGGSLLQPVMASRLMEHLEDGPRARLTQRELEVLVLLASGARNKEIAAELFLSVGTVKFHIANIYQKLNVQTRTEAIRCATERGFLTT